MPDNSGATSNPATAAAPSLPEAGAVPDVPMPPAASVIVEPGTPTDPSANVRPAAGAAKPKAPAGSKEIMAEVAHKIGESRNVLIALSSDPSVDEMAAAIGLSLYLDKLGKRATAIYSGQTPNALEFLKPEETFEATVDTLQDFVIALNKDKADHLRYKLDGDFVKIYITPYRTRIAEEDLDFSYGDFNVDLVLALDVANGIDLDSALREHGRIMHDAVIINITTGNPGKLGEIEWSEKGASSVSEMIAKLLYGVNTKVKIEKEVATAFLTGIVAATNRFSNANTTPETMKVASKLMESGANQQLVSKNITPDVENELFSMAGMASAKAGLAETDPTKLDIAHGVGEEGIVDEDKVVDDTVTEKDSTLLDELKAAEASLASVGEPTAEPVTVGAVGAAEVAGAEPVVPAVEEPAAGPVEPEPEITESEPEVGSGLDTNSDFEYVGDDLDAEKNDGEGLLDIPMEAEGAEPVPEEGAEPVAPEGAPEPAESVESETSTEPEASAVDEAPAADEASTAADGAEGAEAGEAEKEEKTEETAKPADVTTTEEKQPGEAHEGFITDKPEKVLQPLSDGSGGLGGDTEIDKYGHMLEEALASVDNNMSMPPMPAPAPVPTPQQTAMMPAAALNVPEATAVPMMAGAPVMSAVSPAPTTPNMPAAPAMPTPQPTANPAVAGAPAVPTNPEINGVPEINYMPMPGDAVLPPPPTPPIAPAGAVPPMATVSAPVAQPVAPAAPVMPTAPAAAPITPIAPAMPAVQPALEPLGPQPAMQDQVYAPQAADPSAFKIPGM